MYLNATVVSQMYVDLVKLDELGTLDALFRDRYAGGRTPADVSKRYTEFKAEIHQKDREDRELMDILKLEDTPLLFQDLRLDDRPVPNLVRGLIRFTADPSEQNYLTIHDSIGAARAFVDSKSCLFAKRKQQFLCWLIEAVDAEYRPPQPEGRFPFIAELAPMTAYANMDSPTYKEHIPPPMKQVIMNRFYSGANFLAGGKGLGGGASAPPYTRGQVDAALAALRQEKAGVCTNFGLAAAAAILAREPRARVQVMASGGHVFTVLNHSGTRVTRASEGVFVDVWWGALGNQQWVFERVADIPHGLWQYMETATEQFAAAADVLAAAGRPGY